ncbi:MAG: WYL domain-containing protein [Propionibacteriaceae bacterium]|nr:WYL domain-containing protein [Propionibacteriaceae bacterium]
MSTKNSGKGGKEQVPRLLSLVPYLQRRPGARVADVATEFGITPAQLRKDLAVLYMCGLPGLLPGDLIEIDMEAVDGDGVIFLTNAEFLARPLRLSPAEVLPLILGLRTLREVAGSDALASIDSALAKLGSVAGDSVELADRIRIGVRAADEPVREAISTALGAGVRLRLTYESPNRGLSTRLVDPHSLRMRDGYAYLEAWGDPVDPHSEGGWRSFRLDRIVEAEVTGDPVVARPGEPDPPDGWLDRLSTAAEVVLDLDQPATWVAEYYPIEESTPRPGGGLRVRLRVADPAWLRGLLLRLGADATVVSPAGAQRSAVAEAEAAEAHYATLFGADGMP